MKSLSLIALGDFLSGPGLHFSFEEISKSKQHFVIKSRSTASAQLVDTQTNILD